jgi:CheY-like chemotaxis protein
MNSIRILLIEDSQTDALIVKSLLAGDESFQYTLAHATRLADGLALASAQTFDVVLTDLALPDSQGVETVEELRKHAVHLPIIVLTIQNDKIAALEAIRRGAQDFLPKGGFDHLFLMRTITYAIERQLLTQQLHKALAEVKTLSGLLPICAGCKQIRNDEGHWDDIETYVMQRSNASFSHGICPKCQHIYFPEVAMELSRRTPKSDPGSV